MISEVAICNLALSHLGLGSIESLSEASSSAEQCKTVFERARDSVLRGHPWGFAAKRLMLADLGTPPSDWAYRYQYPPDCLKARQVLPDVRGGDYVAFEVGAADNLMSRVILTDKPQATLLYTAAVKDPNVFDELFVRTLSWFVAAEIALPLTANSSILQSAQAMYLGALHNAIAADAGESRNATPRDAEWLRGRG